VRQSTKRLHEKHGHYSGVVVDILYDHFLAKNWNKYHDTPLEQYVDNFYEMLQDNYAMLPERIQRMMPYMMADNWLLSYATVPGISKILTQMNARVQGRSNMNFAVIELKEFYDDFEQEFTSFFEELRAYCHEKLDTL
jgi:acyl carrier protein phosphodiesterase